jgi:hypothetical protein
LTQGVPAERAGARPCACPRKSAAEGPPWIDDGSRRHQLLENACLHAGSRRDIGFTPGRHTRYTDINYSGYITAHGTLIDSFEGQRAYLRSPDGKFQDVGTLPFEEPHTYVFALNSSNHVVDASGPLTFPDQPMRAVLLGDAAAASRCCRVAAALCCAFPVRRRPLWE